MIVTSISQEANPLRPDLNEDAIVHVKYTDNQMDLYIIDGASSLEDKSYVDKKHGDTVWFIQGFKRHIEEISIPQKTIPTLVTQAIIKLTEEFSLLTHGFDVPIYAKPRAALTAIRAIKNSEDGSVEINIFGLKDCTTLAYFPDGRVENLDPFDNHSEQITNSIVTNLIKSGISDPIERKKHLMPHLRENRVKEDASLKPIALSLNPQGPYDFRHNTHNLPQGTELLVMTDGFYRLVDEYNLYADKTLFDACKESGIHSLVNELRNFEASISDRDSGKVKKMDDASVAHLKFY